ncbi:MAG: hypothetical protein IJO52_05620 [Clostridia bacterium]|nr:hypothetical protein [Clostridia bacterium]
MATKVYTFHIAYEGAQEKIWRNIAVSSNYRMDQLGYTVLAAFDTMAYHLFEFYYEDGRFEIPDEDADEEEQLDMAIFKLYQLDLKIGDRIRMDYDFGTTQTFLIELIDIEDMGRGQGKKYPYVTQGAGCGIIDDMHSDELQELIEQIDKNGQTEEPIYYKDRTTPWDYRWFDLDCINGLLKGEIELIEEGYATFWFD